MEKFERIEHLRDKVTLHQADLLDQRSLVDALRALSGYLVLAERLLGPGGDAFAEAWNFGPAADDAKPAAGSLRASAIVGREVGPRSGSSPTWTPARNPFCCRLDSTKAHERLGWVPAWDLIAGLDATVEWYAGDGDVRKRSLHQIAASARADGRSMSATLRGCQTSLSPCA